MLRSSLFLPIRSFLCQARCTRLSAYRYSNTIFPVPVWFSHNAIPARGHWIQLQKQPLPRRTWKRYTTSDATPRTIVDPQRPSLYYHYLSAPNPLSDTLPAYAVSFLDRPPENPYSPAVLGWLLAASNEAQQEAGIGDFKENGKFLDVLHEVIRDALDTRSDKRLAAEAIQWGQGWMHVNDDRKLPEFGRISSPDDIIGSVRVEGGEIVPGTYNPMPTYRICTTDGLTTLSNGLEQRLLKRLRKEEGQ